MTSGPAADLTLDRLLRHLAWANAGLFDRLMRAPDHVLGLASPHNEWTVAMILEHLVSAAGGYAALLEGISEPDRATPPSTAAELPGLAAACAAFDARVRAQAALPEGPVRLPDEPGATHARSTIIAQAIHHATEHRAQVAGALATNGIDVVDLDDLDLWTYEWTHGGAEGPGA